MHEVRSGAQLDMLTQLKRVAFAEDRHPQARLDIVPADLDTGEVETRCYSWEIENHLWVPNTHAALGR